MRVLGIDPGLADLGWGVVEKNGRTLSCLGYGCIQTASHLDLCNRLLHIYQALVSLLKEYQPTHGAVEELYFMKNISSALPVAHARGVVLLCLSLHNCPTVSYTPNNIKQAVTGSGHANKETVQQMTKLLLGLPEIPKPNHAADALACALCRINMGEYHV